MKKWIASLLAVAFLVSGASTVVEVSAAANDPTGHPILPPVYK